MTDLEKLAEQCLRNATAWDAAGPPRVAASVEACQRHAADWDALHTLTVAAGAWVEHIAGQPGWLPGATLRAEEDVVAAVRRMAAHLKEVPHD